MIYLSSVRGKGFTLVEALVVGGILAILASVVLFSAGESRKKARDDRQKVNLKQLQLAIELYAQEHGRYPSVSTVPASGNCVVGSIVRDSETTPYTSSKKAGCSSTYIDTEVSTKMTKYLDKIPNHEDSQSSDCLYNYMVNTGATEYKVLADRCVESETITSDHEFSRCPNGINCGSFADRSYAIYSAGATDW